MTQQNAQQIQLLALQSDACVKRLETLEEGITVPANTHGNAANDRMSIMTTDTAISARSMRESIMSLYGHRSYYQIILDPREGDFCMAPEVQVDHSRISMIIEDHLHPMSTMHSSNDPGAEGPDHDIERLAEDQRYEELVETEATNSLWNTVYMHNKTRHLTPSEKSATSTVTSRLTDIIQIAYIPGVTNRPATDVQSTLRDKPLPCLPREIPGIDKTKTHESNTFYPYQGLAMWSYVANPDDPNELGFKRHEFLEISDISGYWWHAKNELGETGIVPKTYVILL